MRKTSISAMGLAIAVMLGVTVTHGQLATEVESLRGITAIEDNSKSPGQKKWIPDQDPIQRAYVQQPPLIPHSIEGYQINKKFNKCLSCHSWKNYKESEATKISTTHFRDRDGIDLANVSASRYFCTQCHVSQRDTSPLVGNTFESVEALQPR
jgi:cytochrome c-type protein NapB